MLINTALDKPFKEINLNVSKHICLNCMYLPTPYHVLSFSLTRELHLFKFH